MQTDTLGLAALQDRIAYRFRNLLLLTQALTHRSFLYEGHERGEDNERLEFLGDSVIEVVVSHLLLIRFPHLAEGGLSKMRAELVKEATLASLARFLQLETVLRLGRGEDETGGREKASILAGGFEALIAAVYLDGGYTEVSRLIEGLYTPLFVEVSGMERDRDFKTRLQEYTQLHLQVTPQYTVTHEHGPDHAKTFEVVITINGRPYGRGQGRSKKEAEQQAAEEALQSLPGD
ncbi:MAG: ribonuclease III [Deltaproteobacteria bacterium RBG_16_54_18]|nr:MAG: ribonuclease III [Deltaproteobacteria bacterium RBG_16_54_18]